MGEPYEWPQLPPESIVYQGPLPDWAQKEINRICEEREAERRRERREIAACLAIGFIIFAVAIGGLFFL